MNKYKQNRKETTQQTIHGASHFLSFHAALTIQVHAILVQKLKE